LRHIQPPRWLDRELRLSARAQYCRQRPFSGARDARSRPYCSEIGTGLIHIDEDANELPKILGATDRPLNELSERELCPRSKLLAAVNASLR
jgi:hypothetical protein